MYRYCPKCKTTTQHFAGTAVLLPGYGFVRRDTDGPHCFECLRRQQLCGERSRPERKEETRA